MNKMTTTMTMTTDTATATDTDTSRRAYRQVMMDPKRHRFQNKAAVYLTVASLVLIMSLSVLFGEYYEYEYKNNSKNKATTSSYDDSAHRRWLEGEEDDDDQTDFSEYSCRYIYDKTPDAGDAQCQFARTCNSGEGIWAEFVFCSKKHNTITLFWILSPIMLLWMITLFRLLGSTAEDYFSPALEMFSVKLGLPPRFAGVSLLALGNGAADVSATMSAIINDHENGYKLSLGALTGAAMIVGGVVAGVVVLVAGGVPCRGALVRDVLALIVTVLVVWSHLASGTIGPSSITLFLSMYALFVSTVLVADIYHRAVVLPRLAREADTAELQRQISEQGRVIQEAGEENVAHLTQPSDAISSPSALSSIISALSNYDNPNTDNHQTNNNETGAGWGIDSDQLEQDRPIVLHGTHGILHRQGHDQTSPETAHFDSDGSGDYALVVEDHIDRVCVSEGSPGFSAHNWAGAWHDGKEDLMRHATQVWQDVADNGDLNKAEKLLLFLEFPFTIARKVRKRGGFL
jgi:sodium/potassium/calcium exchanger 6